MSRAVGRNGSRRRGAALPRRQHDAAMGRAWHVEDWPAVRAECDRLIKRRPAYLCATPDCGRPTESHGMCRHCREASKGVKRNRIYRYDWPVIDAMRYEGLSWPQIAERTGYKAQQLQWAHYHRPNGKAKRK